MKPAFILGSGRCGSTLVSQILRLHPEVLSLSEVFSTAGARAFSPRPLSGAAFWRVIGQADRLGAALGNPQRAPREFLYGSQQGNRYDPFACPPLLQVALPHLTDRPDALFETLRKQALTWPVQSIQAHYLALFAALKQGAGQEVPVERSGGSLVAARTLRRLFPDARFVLLHRSGAETVLSMCDYPAARLALYSWQHFRRIGLDFLAPDHHYGRGGIWPVLQRFSWLLPVQRILDTAPDPVGMARFWSEMMQRGCAALQDLPGPQLMVLEYEELVAHPAENLARLGYFLTGGAPEPWLSAASALPEQRPSRSARLEPKDRAALVAACEPGEQAFARLRAARQAGLDFNV
ncbi:sulfotransferase [Pseudogemmobacter faecipullorum]|uniref:Sulfotransferase n=1 Tax=Pseudogemmobacter faecipullorum TaxID=2755041 RepID=A0ABS8CQF1_9RHOB|nr:sulfotransferase [Pseudogemmobacter faecipullorum]